MKTTETNNIKAKRKVLKRWVCLLCAQIPVFDETQSLQCDVYGLKERTTREREKTQISIYLFIQLPTCLLQSIYRGDLLILWPWIHGSIQAPIFYLFIPTEGHRELKYIPESIRWKVGWITLDGLSLWLKQTNAVCKVDWKTACTHTRNNIEPELFYKLFNHTVSMPPNVTPLLIRFIYKSLAFLRHT